MASFHYGITSYDFHSYFKLDDPEQVEFAKNFRKSIEEEFKRELSEVKCRIFKTHEQKLGPHPLGHGMFEVDTRSADLFLRLLNFYQLNHGPLSVLIHPRSGLGALKDHTDHALWLGKKLQLDTSVLSNEEL